MSNQAGLRATVLRKFGIDSLTHQNAAPCSHTPRSFPFEKGFGTKNLTSMIFVVDPDHLVTPSPSHSLRRPPQTPLFAFALGPRLAVHLKEARPLEETLQGRRITAQRPAPTGGRWPRCGFGARCNAGTVPGGCVLGGPTTAGGAGSVGVGGFGAKSGQVGCVRNSMNSSSSPKMYRSILGT